MNHPTEEQRSYYYGEGSEIEEHIGGCEQSGTSYRAAARAHRDSFRRRSARRTMKVA
jgi:hypothetical protein